MPLPADLQRYFQQATFLQSAAKFNQCPADTGAEIAFAGRSNAGKSSAINRLTTHKKLARTSKTPGRTQLINFFSLTEETRLVDLPGYGYAKVSNTKKIAWQQHLEQYLEQRNSLSCLVLVMDIRHPLQKFDEIMLNWAIEYAMPCRILLTKADKIKRGPAKQTLLQVEKTIEQHDFLTAQLFSSSDGTGLEEAWQFFYDQLHPTGEPS